MLHADGQSKWSIKVCSREKKKNKKGNSTDAQSEDTRGDSKAHTCRRKKNASGPAFKRVLPSVFAEQRIIK